MGEMDNKDIKERAQELYQAAARDLDIKTRARLSEARSAALAPRPLLSGGRRWVMATAAAGVAAIALSVFLTAGDRADFSNIATANGDDGDVELLLAEENLDMLAELDFYLWLDADPDAG